MQTFSTQRPAPTPEEELLFHRTVCQAVEPGILVVSAQGRLVALNDVAGDLLGPRASGWIGSAIHTLPAPLAEALRDASASGAPTRERTLTLDSGGPERRLRVLWWNVFPLPQGSGLPGCCVVTLHNLEAARELERSTVRLQQLANVGVLAAGVAHEVKNAMVAVKTYVELLLESHPESEEATLVRQELSRINLLAVQLLQLATPPQLLPAPVRLHEILTRALRLVQHRLRDQVIEPVVMLEAADDQVLGDAKQLEQAFLNLLINAAEAMGRHGRLTVRTELVVATEHVSRFELGRRQQQLQTEIRDSGPGMTPDLVERLFHPFVTTKPGGTGLGLTITRRIVQEHRGKIAVESRPGEGSAFRVLLPLLSGSGPAG